MAMDQRDIYLVNNPDYVPPVLEDETIEAYTELMGSLITSNLFDYLDMEYLPEVDHISYWKQSNINSI